MRTVNSVDNVCQRLLNPICMGLFFLSQLSLADPTLPPGFSLTQIASNVTAPTQMEFSPDGRLFASKKNGQLLVIKNGVALAQPFLTVNTDTQGEHGLIGIAFDPEFFTNFYVYVYYVAKTPTIHGRVSRFTANGDVAIAGSEKVIIDLDDRGTSIFHVSGGLHFGKDGKLYISSGDNAGMPFTDNAQRLTNTLGKILRINSDGSIPQDNPFVATTTGINQAIWAYGLRNPFTFSVQPGTGRIFANDVGQTTWEEINDIIGGNNYGWPLAEGMSTNPSFKNPIFTYTHGAQTDDTLGCAITGGTFYNPIIPQFPNQYVGQYFFLDYCNNWIHTFDPVTGTVKSFAKNITSSPVTIITGPDGALYLTSEWFNSIYKLTYTGSQSPEVITQPSDQIAAVGYPVTFSVVAAGAEPLSYQWKDNGLNIPGETNATLQLSSPAMTDSGSQFQCAISNSYGTTSTTVANLKVLNQSPPQLSIDYPLSGATYNAGDTVYFGGSATDAFDSDLPPSAYTWEIHFQHDKHFHPFFPPTSGIMGGSFAVPTQGETSFNSWYRIFLTVKDAQGLSTTLIREIFPNKSVFYLKTSPPGLAITLDGQPATTPLFITGVVGFERTLGVVSPQVINGVTYQFGSWSDGGNATHTFNTSVNTKTYTAVYAPAGSTRSGTLSATPNPIMVCDGSSAGVTTLNWNTQGTANVEIHINAPDGAILTTSGTGPGSFTTPKWVGDGSTFYLQDVSQGLPLTAANTLATTTVNLTRYGCNADRF